MNRCLMVGRCREGMRRRLRLIISDYEWGSSDGVSRL